MAAASTSYPYPKEEPSRPSPQLLAQEKVAVNLGMACAWAKTILTQHQVYNKSPFQVKSIVISGETLILMVTEIPEQWKIFSLTFH